MMLEVLMDPRGNAEVARLPAQRSRTDWARTGLDANKAAEVFVFGPGGSCGWRRVHSPAVVSSL